jgi:hypothetical protein
MSLNENFLKKLLRAVREGFCFLNVEREKPLRQSILRSLGCQLFTKLENGVNKPTNNERNAAGTEKLEDVRKQAHMQSSGKPH